MNAVGRVVYAVPERVVEPGPELGAVPSGEIQCGGGKKWRGGGEGIVTVGAE